MTLGTSLGWPFAVCSFRLLAHAIATTLLNLLRRVILQGRLRVYHCANKAAAPHTNPDPGHDLF